MTGQESPSRAEEDQTRCPTAFRYWDGRGTPRARRVAGLVRTLTGAEVFPPADRARAFCDDLYGGDPVAERFVADVFSGEFGPKRGRAILDRALETNVDDVPEAPPSMRRLFAEFEEVPDWVDPKLVEQGAAIWRRWGTMLFSVAGVTTLEIYTEAAVALPLSLAGGYAGDNALRRFLETCQFWMDVSEPGALFRPGSAGRATAMRVRVMHVSVRRRVADHPEWDAQRWGLPISQSYMLLTQLGGSVAPALALSLLGYLTTPREMRALLHFQRYLGHLLGVQPTWYPETVWESVQILAMTIAARSYDAGEHGAELIESFPRAFAPRDGHRGLRRLREAYNYRVYSAYTALWMAPATRRRYKMPRVFPWLLIPVARIPLIVGLELARRVVPGLGRAIDRVNRWHRQNWFAAQMDGRKAAFDASSGLRR
jgi:hypothetical protein